MNNKAYQHLAAPLAFHTAIHRGSQGYRDRIMPAAPSRDANKDEERLTHVQTNVDMTGPGIHYSSVQHGDFFRAKSDEKSEMTSQLTVDSDVQYLHTYYLIHQRQTLMRKEQRNIDPNADQQESLVERP